MSVLNRRKLTSVNYEAFAEGEVPKYVLMDTFNLAEYEANGFQERAPVDKSLNAYYAATSAASTKVTSKPEPKEVLGDFSYTESGIVICCEKRGTNVYLRNFVLHQVVKRIPLEAPVLTLDVCVSKPRILLTLENGKIKVLEYLDETGKDRVEYQADSYNAFQGAVFCSHNMIATIAGPEVTTYSITN